MNDKCDRRVTVDAELRVGGDGDARHIEGYAAVFNSWSVDLGGFTEKIERGAFDAVLATNPDVRALFNHDPNHVLGRTAAGTLQLYADKRGLRFKLDIPDTTAGRDLAVSVERGDINQASFAFRVAEGGDSWSKNYAQRTITDISDLRDISPVTYPAYEKTKVQMNSADAIASREAAKAEAQGKDQIVMTQLDIATIAGG